MRIIYAKESSRFACRHVVSMSLRHRSGSYASISVSSGLAAKYGF